MKSTRIRTLKISFNNSISFRDIRYFRGAIIAATEGNDVLFHNHLNNGFRYSYPLIQYKRIKDKAAIICIGEGTDAIGEFLNQGNIDLNLHNNIIHLELDEIKADSILLQEWKDSFEYSIRKYIPLNQINYERYISTESILEKYAIIEQCLVGNILSFAKCMGVFFESKIEAKITEIENPRGYTYKGIEMLGFDLSFQTNVSLPNFIGLGRGVSVGYGMIRKMKDITNNKMEHE